MKKPSEITFGNIASSACGGIAAGMVLSFAGAAGTIIGAALGPVVFMLAKELARRPAEGAAALTARSTRRGASGMTATDAASGESAEPRPPRPASRRQRGARVVVVTAALAAAAALAVFAMPELVADRPLVPGSQPVFVASGDSADSNSGATKDATTGTFDATDAPTVTTAPEGAEAVPPPEPTTDTTADTAPPPEPASPEVAAPTNGVPSSTDTAPQTEVTPAP